MIGQLLKGLGVVVLVGGFIGMIGGGILFLFGQQQVSDADDGVLFTDREQARDGEEQAMMGATVFGTSLMAAGLGLALLVAGIVLGGKSQGQQQQQQVIVVAADGARVQPPQMRQ